jgi:hypothetical protein
MAYVPRFPTPHHSIGSFGSNLSSPGVTGAIPMIATADILQPLGLV